MDAAFCQSSGDVGLGTGVGRIALHVDPRRMLDFLACQHNSPLSIYKLQVEDDFQLGITNRDVRAQIVLEGLVDFAPNKRVNAPISGPSGAGVQARSKAGVGNRRQIRRGDDFV